MNIDRETIKRYLSQLTPGELAGLAAELRSDWQLPEPSEPVPDRPPQPPRVVGHDVVLVDLGASRVATIRVLRSALGVDLRAARTLIGELPTVVRQKPTADAAETLAAALREAGATVEVRLVRDDA